MKPALTIPIPLGHVAHWKQTKDGKFEVEMLRFLYSGEAKLRRARSQAADFHKGENEQLRAVQPLTHRMNARARNFHAANEASPVVYFSQDGNLVTFRLASGKVFNMTASEARETRPKLACHLAQHRNEELALLAKVEAEARQPDCGEWR